MTKRKINHQLVPTLVAKKSRIEIQDEKIQLLRHEIQKLQNDNNNLLNLVQDLRTSYDNICNVLITRINNVERKIDLPRYVNTRCGNELYNGNNMYQG